MRTFKIFSLMFCLSHGLQAFVSPALIRFPFRNRLRVLSTVADEVVTQSPPGPYLKWTSSKKYKFGRQIGAGKYSHVLDGFSRESGRPVAIKVLKPCPPWKIKREVRILETLRGGPHIVELVDKIYDSKEMNQVVGNGTNIHEDGKCYGLVFAHCGPTSASPFASTEPPPTSTAHVIQRAKFGKLPWVPFTKHSIPRRLSHRGLSQPYSDLEVRWAMYQLFECLEYAHEHKIIHRDLKPANVLASGRGFPGLHITVADWGLADFDFPGARHAVRVASRPFKAPELLLGDPYYSCSADLWSVGCIFAGLLFHKDPFIKGKDAEEQISKLAQVLGSDGFHAYAKRYLDKQQTSGVLDKLIPTKQGGSLSPQTLAAIGKHPKLSWVEYSKMLLNEESDLSEQDPEPLGYEVRLREKMKLATTDALDLLNKLLCFDRNQRITAKEAKRHCYFEPIREKIGLLMQ